MATSVVPGIPVPVAARRTAEFAVPKRANTPVVEDPYANRYLIAIAVTLGAVLELVDTSIVNVAIPHMMGTLGATLDEITWVSTSYIIANVIVIPMSGWLSAYFGRRRYLTGSIMMFRRGVVHVWCGDFVVGIGVVARRFRGLVAARCCPRRSQRLFEAFPPSRNVESVNQSFGVGVMVGPTIGPTIGGYHR